MSYNDKDVVHNDGDKSLESFQRHQLRVEHQFLNISHGLGPDFQFLKRPKLLVHVYTHLH